MSVGKKFRTCYSRIQWAISLLFGALIGLLLAPKRGREMRIYLKSDTFTNKLKNAGAKSKSVVKTMRKEASKLTKSVSRLIDKTRARYGK